MSSAAARAPTAPRPTVLLAGNPNSGKTTVFNALTGARARVGNYPGVTVDRRSATLELEPGLEVELIDLPGTYSLTARSAEERIAVDSLLGQATRPDAVVVVIDATSLARGLYLCAQVVESGLPMVLALNMMDEAERDGIAIDREALASRLGCEVVPMVASKARGKPELLAAVRRALARSERPADPSPVSARLVSYVERVEKLVGANAPELDPSMRRAYALWALLSLGDDELAGVPAPLRAAVAQERARARDQGVDLDSEIIGERYARIDAIVGAAVKVTPSTRRLTDRIDAVLVHPVLGVIVFALVMVLVFEALFSGAEPAIRIVEVAVSGAQDLVNAAIPAGALRSLLADGVIAGVGNVVVFVPQIALLSFFITILEDSGYLARVAFVIDRVMRSVGLHGKAFVPMLSGFACAVPAIIATRTIESRRDRLLTMMVIPFTSCSARLPVYVLVVATVFRPDQRVLGFLSIGAVVLFAMYAFSVVAALGAAAVLRRTVLRGPRPPLVLELPPYRMPVGRNIAWQTWRNVRSFLVDAGTLILAITIVLWALVTYPRSDEVTARYDSMRAEVSHTAPGAEREAALATLAGREASEQLRHSVAGRVGRALEPAIAPLGWDWRIGVGILGAFAAREVFVSTLGVVFGVERASEENEPLRHAVRRARKADGSRLFTPLSGVALMVFFVLAAQCMSTVATLKRESGSWKWPALLIAYMTTSAYVAALLVYQVGSALGLGGAA